MRLGIAADHGGFNLKADLIARFHARGYTVIDFGADDLDPADDYPDFVIPLAEAVGTEWADRGIVLCSSGAGASICANKILGARAALISARAAARQAVEDDHMNILCLDGSNTRLESAWDIIRAFLEAKPGQADCNLRRLGKVALLEGWHAASQARSG